MVSYRNTQAVLRNKTCVVCLPTACGELTVEPYLKLTLSRTHLLLQIDMMVRVKQGQKMENHVKVLTIDWSLKCYCLLIM